jgi:hypothetical protein
VFLVGSPLKKRVVLQVNDAAVSLRLVVFGSIKYSSFIHRLQNRLEGGGGRGERRGMPPWCYPSDLLCCLTVIYGQGPPLITGGEAHITNI